MMRRTLRRRRRDADHPLVRGRLTRNVGEQLTWDIRSGGHLAVVVVNGELDAGTAPGLGGQLEPLAGTGSHLILDLAGLRFCDCAGLNLFLRLQQRARAAGGSLQLAAPTPSVRRLITLARLSGVLPTTASPADVIAALDPSVSTGPPLPPTDDGDLGSGQQLANR
jgi:anti-sigma B factor antagonist